MPTKREKFIEKAKSIHGDKYNYDLVDYINCKVKVKIICPIHGEFEQTPDHHINGKNGCPLCRVDRIKNTVRDRYGVDYVSQNKWFQEKVESTNMQKYGVRRPLQNEDIHKKSIITCRNNWGVDYPMQSCKIVKKFQLAFEEKYGVISPLALDAVRKKIKETNLARYGVENPMQCEEIRHRAVDTLINRYGVDNPSLLEDFAEKSRNTFITNWGVAHPMQLAEVRHKQFATRKKSGTVNTSMAENQMHEMLSQYFGGEHVHIQYLSDIYPYHCDFYIDYLDLYIELNAHWTHGGHWFDENNQSDVDTLYEWQELAKDSDYYKNAVNVWSVSDVAKRKCAIDNNLNYLVFWDNDLLDFYLWMFSLLEN